jgi:hypothetical protein
MTAQPMKSSSACLTSSASVQMIARGPTKQIGIAILVVPYSQR